MPGIQPTGAATASSAGHGYGVKELLEALQSQEQHCGLLISTEASYLLYSRPAHSVNEACHVIIYCEDYGVSVNFI